MLIEIDSSAVEDAIGNGRSTAASRDCIDNLLLAHHACKHVICLGKNAAAQLENIDGAWSPRARGALRSIRGRHNEIRGLRDRLKWIVRVGVGRDFALKTVNVDGKVRLHAPLQRFDDLARVSAGATLLGENLLDTKLYRILGEAFLAENGWRWSLCFDEQPGGGSTTAPLLEKLVADEKLTLAIVDSDRSYPNGSFGKTAECALKVNCSALQQLHILHVRDIENMIPSSIYEQAFAAVSHSEQPLRSLKEAERLNSKHPWRDHADIKEGITLFDIATMTPKDAISFWRAVAKDLQRHQCANPECVSACGREKKTRDCVVTPALGKGALKMAVSWMQQQDRKRIAKLMHFRDTAPTVELCEKILAWGIAEQRGSRA